MLFNPTVLLLPFAGLGLGLSDPPLKIDVDVLTPKFLAPIGLGEPNEPRDVRRAPFKAFWIRGLPAGEKGDPIPARFPFPSPGLR